MKNKKYTIDCTYDALFNALMSRVDVLSIFLNGILYLKKSEVKKVLFIIMGN